MDQIRTASTVREARVYLMLLPALLSIALWAYYPLARGPVIAFQEYNERGFSRWVGMEKFATVLFDPEFWYAVWIALAFLLTEVPRGKILFRTIFLWKGFYGTAGMINQVLNFFVGLFNHLPGVTLAPVNTVWLDSPEFALFFCLLPTVWAGMGPGCRIYFAALKTVPEEIYEAAEIDGAGEWTKFWTITMNTSKPILAFTHAYSAFMMALIIIPDQKMWTLMVWIFQLQTYSHPTVVFASLVIAAIPTFIIFVLCQNIIMRGIVVPSEK